MVRVLAFLVFIYSSVFGVSDILGRDVKVSGTEKLVFIGPGALRLGVYLGLEDRIVGVEAWEKKNDFNAPYSSVIKAKNLHEKPVIGEGGPGKMPSMEALIESGAELIIASFMSKDQMDLIETKTKIPVLGLSYGAGYGGNLEKMDSLKKSLLLLGEVTGVEARAKELVSFMDAEEKKLKSLTLEPKTIYVGGVSFKGSWGIGSTEADYLPFYLLGVENALGEKKSGHLFVDIERILEVDPDVIFIDYGGERIVKDEIKTKSEFFNSLKAFKNDQIHWVLPFNFYNTNVENCFIVAWNAAQALGVEVDLEAKKAEIYKMFLGE
ncbi:MAG: ABC transporter substrate-binding protein [Campylobacteraceae bacterium]|nr:ABC transporter substrate-binding protein [Campylobacteraceae bacterium]